MDLPCITIIWCDTCCNNDYNYNSLRDGLNEMTTMKLKLESDLVDTTISADREEQLFFNNVVLITVNTSNDIMFQIEKYKKDKIFLICSSTIARCLIPDIVRQYPLVFNIYVFIDDNPENNEWTQQYSHILKTFYTHIDLLVQLKRDIAIYIIKQGQMYLKFDAPQNALICFNYARNLEEQANVAIHINAMKLGCSFVEFREQLNLFEGIDRLVSQAEIVIHAQEYILNDS